MLLGPVGQQPGARSAWVASTPNAFPSRLTAGKKMMAGREITLLLQGTEERQPSVLERGPSPDSVAVILKFK